MEIFGQKNKRNNLKVCYISNYRNSHSGYAQAARDYILSLDSIDGVKVVPRHVSMLPSVCDISNRIKDLEKGDLNNIDIVLTHNLPSEFIRKGPNVKNVGMFAYEGSNFINTNWKYHLGLMDQILVFCKSQIESIRNTDASLVDRVKVIPHAIDTLKFDKDYPKIDLNLPNNCFKFYTIAENNRRKNLSTLIATFYSSFSITDNVALVIKTNGSIEQFKKMCEEVKSGIKRFNNPHRYPRIVVITEHLSDEKINSLHKSCQCFVTASHGECFCLPAMDALGFGNPVIAPEEGAFLDYFREFGFLIEGTTSITVGENNTPDGLYTSDEEWFNVSMPKLSRLMQWIVQDQHIHLLPETKMQRRNYVENFSYLSVGTKLKNILES